MAGDSGHSHLRRRSTTLMYHPLKASVMAMMTEAHSGWCWKSGALAGRSEEMQLHTCDYLWAQTLSVEFGAGLGQSITPELILAVSYSKRMKKSEITFLA